MTETWFPFCNRRDGPLSKTGYYGIGTYRDLNIIRGEVKHSAEGGRAGMYAVLDDPNRQASWNFSIFKSGPPDQHYPLETITWTSGGPYPNTAFVGMEHEGGGPDNLGEPLTENQIHWTTEITKEIRRLCSEVGSYFPSRVGGFPPGGHANLFEHNEMTHYGSASTLCPNGRIPWGEIIKRLTEVNMGTVDVRLVKRMHDDKVYEVFDGTTGIYLVHIPDAKYLVPGAKIETLDDKDPIFNHVTVSREA